MKKLFIILLSLVIMPVWAGELQNALDNKENVFLYVYTEQCGYCHKFNPIYQKLSKMYDKNYGFVKINAYSNEGTRIMKGYRANYVPFVALINAKNNKAWQIQSSCLIDTACVEKAMKNFIK